ncbi:transposable element Tcb2 transposase [Trichonephila clavipes]|nr:transposable element Tcb2 transposase [Trichonephila clavipes]
MTHPSRKGDVRVRKTPVPLKTRIKRRKEAQLQKFAASTNTVVGGGGHRKRIAVGDRYVVSQVKRVRYQSASLIVQQMCAATGRQVLVYCGQTPTQMSPIHCIPLKISHRWHRLEWCKEHKNWSSHQWSHVFLTDESRFRDTSDYNAS